jgi:hypothetical protein
MLIIRSNLSQYGTLIATLQNDFLNDKEEGIDQMIDMEMGNMAKEVRRWR